MTKNTRFTERKATAIFWNIFMRARARLYATGASTRSARVTHICCPRAATTAIIPIKRGIKYGSTLTEYLFQISYLPMGLKIPLFLKTSTAKSCLKIYLKLQIQKKTNAEIMLLASIQFHIIIQEMYNSLQRIATNSNVNKIKKMLDDNIYEKDISLKAIADNLCISQAQIINIFKRTFNMTPYQYFSKKRIEIAASLLLNSDTPIKEIAALLNYSDQPYFSNAFKKIMGISPEKYRKMNVNSDITKSNINNKILMEQAENLPFALKVDRH